MKIALALVAALALAGCGKIEPPAPAPTVDLTAEYMQEGDRIGVKAYLKNNTGADVNVAVLCNADGENDGSYQVLRRDVFMQAGTTMEVMDINPMPSRVISFNCKAFY